MNTLKTMIGAALVMMPLILPAAAQQRANDGLTDEMLGNTSNRFSTKLTNQPKVLEKAEKSTASSTRPTIGPDLFGKILSPVALIVNPINDGLKALDGFIEPVNTFVQPITGPVRIGSGSPPTQVAAARPVAAPVPPAPKPHANRTKNSKAVAEKGKPKADAKPPA